MPPTLAKLKNRTKLTEAIVSTLSFFHIYNLPLSSRKVWELLYKHQATLQEVETELNILAKQNIIFTEKNLFSLTSIDTLEYDKKREEIERRFKKIKKYYWLLSAIPYVESISVINSVAMGNADSESDIDFFVITKPNRLYFVRTFIIMLFKLLGVYKTKSKINEQFCFGFYITSNRLSLKDLLLSGEDPYMVFWMGTIIPITGEQTYQKFIKENKWIYSFLPNFRPEQRLEQIRTLQPSRKIKKFLEIICWVKAVWQEPILRWYHIRHTFKLPENHWATSSTIANKQMLKLHALDPRKDLRKSWQDNLESLS